MCDISRSKAPGGGAHARKEDTGAALIDAGDHLLLGDRREKAVMRAGDAEARIIAPQFAEKQLEGLLARTEEIHGLAPLFEFRQKRLEETNPANIGAERRAEHPSGPDRTVLGDDHLCLVEDLAHARDVTGEPELVGVRDHDMVEGRAVEESSDALNGLLAGDIGDREAENADDIGFGVEGFIRHDGDAGHNASSKVFTLGPVGWSGSESQ